MNGLSISLFLIACIACIVLFGYGHLVGKTQKDKLLMIVFGTVLLGISIGGYASLGRWSDWQNQKIDTEVNYLLTAKITEAQRQVKNMPKNIYAQLKLAEVLMEAGQYADAVEVYDTCLELGGEKVDVLSKKAYALYYRDARQITPQTQAVIDRVLSMNALDVQTRMLLGQDAFLNQRYTEAIEHWKMLLDSGAAPAQERALRNAIANAELRAQKQD